MRQPSEETLITYIKENQAQFYRLAYSYVKNREEALDLVQDAVVRALERCHTLRSREGVRTWFYRILVNLCLDHLRRRQKVVFLEEPLELERPREEGGGAEERMDLADALERLPPHLKTVVFLRFYQDMQLQEIAQVTGEKLSTVKTRLYRALDLLHLDLSEQKGGNGL